ncbi:MAG: thiol oxidoreductase [Rhodobacterales bacterium]|nr:MAG: thiol oxidoreductase [Rhodobacterales bacterium]
MRPIVTAVCLAAVTAIAQTPSAADQPIAPRTPEDAAKVAAILAPPTDFSKPEAFEANPAGAATVRVLDGTDAFSLPSANIADEMAFSLGNALFQKLWVAAPSSTKGSDGLGPLYNARACQDCHVKDGRGAAPTDAGDVPGTFLLRLGLPDLQAMAAHVADPAYGHQLQTFAAPGQSAEGRVAVSYSPMPITLADGTLITLRRPTYTVDHAAYGPLDPSTVLSPRIAPQMIGLGLLEAIPEAEILAREDPDDTDGDGISGRANRVDGQLGRFGLKAGQPSLRDQSAQAFATDMGLSTDLHPDPWGDCSALQPACLNAPHGQEPGFRDGLEVDRNSLDLVTYYARNLGVPARRKLDDPATLRGKAIFHSLNCTGCHTPKHVTARLPDQPEQSFQLIWPYTDLLLHDMGEALADSLPEHLATGREWRTPPLWGLGLTQQVSPNSGFLHDGRARTILEAILWHGGEAEPQRDAVINLAPEDRAALLSFLESL